MQISVDEVERSVAAVDTGSVVAAITVGVVRSVEAAQTADALFWVLSVLLLGQIHPSSYCTNKANGSMTEVVIEQAIQTHPILWI